LRAELPAFDVDRKLLDLLKFIAAGLCVFEESSDVCVTVLVELLTSTLVQSEDLHVYLRQRLVGIFVGHLELTERFQDADFEVARVERLEVLLVFSCNLND